MKTFNESILDSSLISVLNELGYTTPTDIQAQAIPLLLKTTKIDFHGQAQTGTGKTLAFGLPMLQQIDITKKHPQALIIAPTRELVVQICQSLEPFAKAKKIALTAVYGGVSFEQQKRSLKMGSHVIVGTPGRLLDHYTRNTLSLTNIKTIVLDEADIMLDMGFREEIDSILKALPEDRNIWLFSATIKEGIHQLLKTHMKNPVSISVSKQDVTSTTTKQFYCVVPGKYRLEALCKILEDTPEFFGFIFCQTKIATGELAQELMSRGYKASALHGDLTQPQRNRIIKDFKAREFTILVATDVAARGIDVPDATCVINYSFPDDPESYVHRIGRTGRAGKEGIAITFITPTQSYLIKQIEKKYKMQVAPLTLPTRAQLLARRTQKALEYIQGLLNDTVKADDETVQVITNALKDYSHDQLVSTITALMQDKFFKHLPQQDWAASTTTTSSSNYYQSSSDMIELALNVGSDDGVFKQDIIDLITQQGSFSVKEVNNIKVIKRRTFVIIPAQLSEQFITCFSKKQLGGRKIYVNRTESAPREYRPRSTGRSRY